MHIFIKKKKKKRHRKFHLYMIGKEPILRLINELDKFELLNKEKEKTNEENKDFVMPIQIVYNLTGVGIAVIGKVLQGSVETQENVELYGAWKKPSTTTAKDQAKLKSKSSGLQSAQQKPLNGSVGSLKLFGKSIKCGLPRDYLGVALHSNNITTKNVRRGMTVILKRKTQKKGSDGDSDDNPVEHWKHTWSWTCQLTLLDEQLGGRRTPIQSGFMPTFYFLTTEVTGTVDLLDVSGSKDPNLMLSPGDTSTRVQVTLLESCVVWKGLTFVVRERGQTIGYGTILDAVEI
ncbi:translation elongation factor Tu [Reticulomyxa filosa]|uniref:Translation elongation factor Tu n=1 Tax=Reticulomyxa filosa TaxID=46433 RepID=X6NCV6_RETFI|nr:translation elongation factor Tu [Reticulomyxa filosa]|eukprot:ETO24155.1 translation elongation factor Tu [Reticulomyxa filosa]